MISVLPGSNLDKRLHELLITGLEMERSVEPVEGCNWPKMIVPESHQYTFHLVGGQKIIVKGDGILAALPVLMKMFDAATELRADPTKDSIVVEYPKGG
jgi:hypothetical protein